MRQALRSLLKARGFAAVAIITLTIGIGSTTAVFSIVDAVMLRPLPFKDADRLVVLIGDNPRRGLTGAAFSYPAFDYVNSRARALDGISAFTNEQFSLTGVERPEQIAAARVSAAFFDVIGVGAAAGRTFDRTEAAPGSHAIVIGHGFWIRRFGGHRDIVGTSLRLNGAPYEIVGALASDLPPPFANVDIWAPRPDEVSNFTPVQVAAGLGYLSAVARLREGIQSTQAQSEMDGIVHAYARENPANTDADPDATLRLVPIRQQGVGNTRSPLLVLAGAVALVLLAACANVANLLLVRATARSHEAAVRVALGASRWDLVRWMTAESLVLAFCGCALGSLMAFWCVDLGSVFLAGLPRASEIAVDWRALAFSIVVSTAAGLAFGVAPARRLSRQPVVDGLRSSGRGWTRRGVGSTLVVAEVAVSFVLLIAAALLLESFGRMLTAPVGFQPEALVTMRLSLPTSRYQDASALRSFMNRLTARLDSTPGVVSAAASMVLPPNATVMAPYQVADAPQRAIGERPAAIWSAVTPRYFTTIGVPMLDGRGFSDADNESAPLVVVVSSGLAKRAWPNQSPLGKRLLVGRQTGFAEVVGVVGDVRNAGLNVDPMPQMYTPYAQRPWPSVGLVIRPAGSNPLAIVNSIRAAVAAVDADQPVTQVQTMDAALADSVATSRLTTVLLGAFALVALMMAAAGLYGVIAYGVAQRTREIGVRVALGADPGAVLRLVTRQGIRLAMIGLSLGAVGAVAAGRAIRSQLFGTSPTDLPTYVAMAAVFAAVAFLACVIPARRALRVDPVVALRE